MGKIKAKSIFFTYCSLIWGNETPLLQTLHYMRTGACRQKMILICYVLNVLGMVGGVVLNSAIVEDHFNKKPRGTRPDARLMAVKSGSRAGHTHT